MTKRQKSTEYVSLETALKRRPVDPTKVKRLTDKMRRESQAYRLVELRKEHNVTQVELAQRLGINQSGISRIERGDLSTTEIGTLAAFVEALGGSLEIGVRMGTQFHRIVDFDQH